MKRWFRVFICLMIAMALSMAGVVAHGGASSNSQKPLELDVLTRCENTVAFLDSLAQKTKPNDLIIVIARLGERENVRGLNRRRLHNVKTYLTEYLTSETVRRKPESIILAEGESVKGYGLLEFYIQGQLVRQLKIRRNADLLVGSCYHEPEEPCPPENRNLYPCRDKYIKPVNRRFSRSR